MGDPVSTTLAARPDFPPARRITRFLGVAALVAVLAIPAQARADRLVNLSRTLESSKHEKARIAAAVSLGRMKDRRALKPLVRALRDENRVVRAVAAASLGHLGDTKALPSLKRATRDSDATVRRRATQAIVAIRKANSEEEPATKEASRNTQVARRAGFGNRPRKLDPRPTLYLVLKSTTDESKSRTNKKTRQRHADKMRSYIEAELSAAPDVTTSEQEALAYGIERNTLDASITKLDGRIAGPYVEVECEIRIAISNDRGKMLSFLTGGAKVQIPKGLFSKKQLPRLRLEAIENAVKSVNQDLISYLRPRRSG